MNDPFLTRDWAEHHHDFTGPLYAAIRRAADVVRVSLNRLHRYEFDAPWQRHPICLQPARARSAGRGKRG